MNRTAPATVTAESGRTDAVWPVPVGPSEPEPGSEGGMIDPSTDLARPLSMTTGIAWNELGDPENKTSKHCDIIMMMV